MVDFDLILSCFVFLLFIQSFISVRLLIFLGGGEYDDFIFKYSVVRIYRSKLAQSSESGNEKLTTGYSLAGIQIDDGREE